MDDEWDLHAVVRSCNTISNDANATSGTNTTTDVEEFDDGFDNMEGLASENDMNLFSYSNSSENPLEGLEEVYKEGCSQPLITNTGVVSFDDEQQQVLDGSSSFTIETPARKR